ncbi:alpha/beta hydrolase [Polaribacter huanghezhanensis]|uniref:alpha/beta hydrolase n=1 Tax=Polaribacter huanghezhanensis TaxID=1354726 RepID=UPI0026479FB4|nr:alpha/beta hydrolase [Polaribacter huanghezhanensis]
MIRKIFLLSISLMTLLSCTESEINYINQAENQQRYDSQIFETITISKDVRYGANVTLGGATTGLSMDIYQPANDTEINKPLVVLAHGGSYLSGDKSDFTELATFLAKAGYVVASINYRLLDITPTQLAFKQVAINSVADMKAAVRYFTKDAATNNVYRIDASKVFIGGYSAGAITALHYAYVHTNTELTSIGGSSFVDYVNSKGGLEGMSGNESFPSVVKAVINISGALFSSSFINSNEPNLYSTHGTDDAVVPYLQGDVNHTGIIADGSGILHPYATSIGLSSELNTIQNGKHDAFLSCTSCLVEIRTFLYSQLQ